MSRERLTVIRHSYDDHSYIDGKNDTSLTKRGVEIARDISDKFASNLAIHKEVMISSSPKKRAFETAEILYDTLRRKNIPADLYIDSNLAELNQGEFVFEPLGHDERVNFLQSCWDDFETERYAGNILHRFGERKIDSGIVIQPGENHSEFSARIGKSVLRSTQLMNPEREIVNITHRAATLNIQNVIKFLNSDIEMDDVENYITRSMRYCEVNNFTIRDLSLSTASLVEYVRARENI